MDLPQSAKIRVKMTALEDLVEDIRACRICRDQPQGKRLPHEPRPVLQISSHARLLIVGQAPGIRVHHSGRPFTDPSGDRLRRWLGIGPEIFYDAEKVAILPMGFCFPGQTEKGADLPPRSECAGAWRRPLMGLLPHIELIVALGLYAQKWHMGDRVGDNLTETVKTWRQGFDLIPQIIPMPHPSWRNNAWLKANPWFERDVVPVLRDRVRELT
jgi:uracil-DNA glycosylase